MVSWVRLGLNRGNQDQRMPDQGGLEGALVFKFVDVTIIAEGGLDAQLRKLKS